MTVFWLVVITAAVAYFLGYQMGARPQEVARQIARFVNWIKDIRK